MSKPTTTRRRRLPLGVKIATGVALALGIVAAPWITAAAANATETPQVCYGEPIPGTDGTPATYVPLFEHTRELPGTPEVPGVPAVDPIPEKTKTVYEYQKETKTTRVHKHGKVEHVSDWSWWAPKSIRPSESDVEVLESGPHARWTEGPWTYTREYRYVKNGQKVVTVTQPFVPGKPAVDPIPAGDPTTETTWSELPVLDGWTATGNVKDSDVVATPAVPATPETPVVIDCPTTPTDPPTEEPTSPPTTTPTTPVIVPPAPGVTPPPTSGPSPSLPTPTPSLPASPLSPSPTTSAPVSAPRTSASPQSTRSIPAPTSSRPELAETGAGHWVGWLSFAAALVFVGIVTVLTVQGIQRRRAL